LETDSAPVGSVGVISATVATNTDTVAPSGVIEGITVTAYGTSATTHTAYYSSVDTTSTYTISAYLKQGNATHGQIIFGTSSGSAGLSLIFDFADGTFVIDNSGDPAYVLVGSGSEDVGNGWYRLHLAVALSAARGYMYVGPSDGNRLWASTGTEYCYVWGLQFEEGSTPSSYIPTAGSAITRAAETLTIPSANLPWPTPNVIGSELVTNGTFDTDISGWSNDGTSTIAWNASGYIDVDRNSSGVASGSQCATHTITGLTVGKVYIISGEIVSLTNSASIQVWDTTKTTRLTGTDLKETSTGVYDYPFVATETSAVVALGARDSLSAIATFDNISVKEIDPLSVSIQMDGRMTYADTNSNPEARLFHWVSGANYIRFDLRTDSTRTGGMSFYQSPPATQVASSDLYYSPDILVPFNIAGRHGSTFLNGALSGTALTANTTPTALPDLSSTDLDLAQNYMGTIRTFRIWDADLTDEGIAYVSERSEEPTISLSFNSSESSFTVSDWLP
jgi:hypothetical protein